MIDEKILKEALILNNKKSMDEWAKMNDQHEFSPGFLRRMRHYLNAQKKYSGRVWMERLVRYSSVAAAIIISVISINMVSAKVFDVNLWKIITEKTKEYTQVSFEKEKVTAKGKVEKRFVVKMLDGYKEISNSLNDGVRVQVLKDNSKRIMYVEDTISKDILIDIESGKKQKKMVGDKTVYYEKQKESIVAYFIDDKYYHMITVSGKDASEVFVNKVINNLEEYNDK